MKIIFNLQTNIREYLGPQVNKQHHHKNLKIPFLTTLDYHHLYFYIDIYGEN